MRVIAKFTHEEHIYDADRVLIDKDATSVKIIKYIGGTVDESGCTKPVKITETFMGVVGTYENGEVVVRPAIGVSTVALKLG